MAWRTSSCLDRTAICDAHKRRLRGADRGHRYRHLLGVRRHLNSRHASLSQREISLICDIARDGCEAVEVMD